MLNRQIVIVAVVGLFSSAQAGTVLHADDDAPLGGDGLTWNSAYRFLQDALADAAMSGGLVTRIRVAQGTYKPDQDEAGNVIPGDRGATFQLISGVSLSGGFAGLGAPNPDERDAVLFETILSGDLLGDDRSNDFPFGPSFGENSYHVTNASGVDETAVLDGFTITAGIANGLGNDQRGGGTFIEAGSPSVINCRFVTNAASRGGGMFCNSSASLMISGCTFTSNSADIAAGLECQDSSVTMTRCTFTGNVAPVSIGGIFAIDSTLSLNDCVFNSNCGMLGIGGVAATASTTVTNCVFAFNYGAPTAGGIESAGDLTVINSLFVTNIATFGGGAILARGASHIVNCTFFGNLGDAALNSHGQMMVENCIIWESTAPVDGLATVSYSDVQGGFAGSGNINAEPLFVAGFSGTWTDDAAYDPSSGLTTLTDASASFVPSDLTGMFLRFGDFPPAFQFLIVGNSERTIEIWGNWSFITAGSGYEVHSFRLAPGSPCTDAGDNTAVPEDITTDLDGNPRFLDVPETPDTGNGDPPIVDMGAYESLGGGCLAITSQEVVCHPDGSTFTLNVEGLSACTGDTVMASFTGSGGAVGEDLCFTVMVDHEQGGLCCSTEVCVPVPDCSSATGDLDGDGIVGAIDLMMLLAQLGPCAGSCWADMDHDGVVGVADLLILLGNWG